MDENTKPVPSVRAALQALVSMIRSAWLEAGSPPLEACVAEAEAALAAPFGLTDAQESKYTTCEQTGRIKNRATGALIPDDEPVMIFRAKDVHAAQVILRYHDLILETGSTFVDSCFERAQAFIAFRDSHPESMRKPD